MQCILANLPNWIQALVAVGILVFTGWTLSVLRGYAADTNRIAEASVTQTKMSASQLEHSQMPFLGFAISLDRFGQQAGWGIENQGSGPAINVKWVQIQSGKGVRSIPSLAVGATTGPDTEVGNTVMEHAGMQIDYESLSGLKYRTVITWEGAIMQTQFQRLGGE